MNSELRKKANNDFEIDFFKLMNNSVFGKTISKLVSEPNYHTTKLFSESLIAIETRKIKVNMDKPIYLGLAILDLSKTVMHEFW